MFRATSVPLITMSSLGYRDMPLRDVYFRSGFAAKHSYFDGSRRCSGHDLGFNFLVVGDRRHHVLSNAVSRQCLFVYGFSDEHAI